LKIIRHRPRYYPTLSTASNCLLMPYSSIYYSRAKQVSFSTALLLKPLQSPRSGHMVETQQAYGVGRNVLEWRSNYGHYQCLGAGMRKAESLKLLPPQILCLTISRLVVFAISIHRIPRGLNVRDAYCPYINDVLLNLVASRFCLQVPSYGVPMPVNYDSSHRRMPSNYTLSKVQTHMFTRMMVEYKHHVAGSKLSFQTENSLMPRLLVANLREYKMQFQTQFTTYSRFRSNNYSGVIEVPFGYVTEYAYSSAETSYLLHDALME
jgi:hypothetical protein